MDNALKALLDSSSHLLESKQKQEENVNAGGDLQNLLQQRLDNYYSSQGIEQGTPFESLGDVQLATATESLSLLERIEAILLQLNLPGAPEKPFLGSRDLGRLRTLISLVFKWGTEPLLKRVNDTWQVDPKGKGSRIVEVEDRDQSFATLSSITTRIFAILLPNGVHGNISSTFIATTLTSRHLMDILRPSITLGWLPASLSTTSMPTIDHLRPLTMCLLSTLYPAQLIAALGGILSDGLNSPTYVRKAASSFLTQQLLRPGGVMGLCESVFGEEEISGETVNLDKLEQLARTLVSVPGKMTPKEYFGTIIPRIIQLLSDTVPASYRKIGAFTLSQMLDPGRNFKNQEVAAPIIYLNLHYPFMRLSPAEDTSSRLDQIPLPSTALSHLLILVSNCDPSPQLISALLSPIVPSLYSLLFHLFSQRASDPQLRESVQGLLVTWGKIVDASNAVDLLWSLIQSAPRQYWETGLDGSIRLVSEPESLKPLDMLTPEDLKTANEQDSFDANLFDLYPDPNHFVQFLRSLNRDDVVPELFIKTLEAYHQSKSSKNNPIKSLHYLQLFMQMQLQLLRGSSSSILRKPEQLLLFIKQVLESTSERTNDLQPHSRLGDVEDGEDSDDDDPNSEIVKPNDEMVETTINLLLSVLENHESLSARTAPILNEIFSLLEPISFSDSSTLRPIAREARMVITARAASTSAHQARHGRGSDEESAQEVYQKALKLLQDPILPVRAHGLLLLRQLVTRNPKSAGSERTVTDPALVPAILSIFLQSIQDEDSYIFLNGVQGLAAMVDGFGKEVLKGLVRQYGSGIDGASTMSQQDLDVRIRIGEALSTVILRCGTSLGQYGDILIPVLSSVFRSKNAPVALRSSSLSLLADCINTYPLVTIQYTEDLAQGVVDMLQVESRSAPMQQPKPSPPKRKEGEHGEARAGSQEETIKEIAKPSGDNDHLSVHPSYPPFRRAGLHLLGLLIRAAIRTLDEGQPVIPFSGAFVKRAHITLGYVMTTDNDAVVRAMAREVNEELTSFESYLLGMGGS